jgi:hypothetical protein
MSVGWLANLGRSLGLSVSGPNLSKSIYQPNNLNRSMALFVDFQSCYHDYFEPRQAQDAPADPQLRPLIAPALGSPLVWFASLKNAAGRHHELVQG